MVSVAQEPRSHVGRFQVLGALGAGATGEVLLARDPELGRKVAIKLLRPTPARSQDQLRLRSEARALARLGHPNVVTVYELGEHEGRDFMVSELAAGTLRDWCLTEPRRADQVLRLFLQAARGLEAAHAAGLVHRDFKPENVLIGEDGVARVADFGLVSVDGARGEVPDEADVEAVALTQTGMLVGTPVYMSPEQTRGETADARSDQFAFCVSLYECLAGVRPFAGARYAELVRNVRAGKVRPARDGRSMPGWLRRILLRGLHPDATQRFTDMPALIRALERGATQSRNLALACLAALTALLVVLMLARGAPSVQAPRAQTTAVSAVQAATPTQAPTPSQAATPSQVTPTRLAVAAPTPEATSKLAAQPAPASQPARTKRPQVKLNPADEAAETSRLDLSGPAIDESTEKRARLLDLDDEP